MSEIRYGALQSIASGSGANGYEARNSENGRKISDIFAKNVFNLMTMKEYLTEGTFLKMINVIKHNAKIDLQTAENVAKGMKKWAMDNGATHYTHWFQPLTGSTAEKHDAFYKPSLDIMVQGMENLSASELIQREPDASSFPNGGLRNTSEARGYTIWDPSSPAFIMEISAGKTLYIPSIFISYTGDSLDYKTPLLKSNNLLDTAATGVCHYFNENVTNVITTLGWEQEYFLIDEKFYSARPDLVMTGRTLFGNKPAKGQQMEDHYFASIPERVQKYIIDFEKECLKLGIPVLTRHNEVAPAQYECAPMFEELNVAVDHNMLLMDIMHRTASRHGLRILFHEKPFAGINGSGKHNNWSMATDRGKNLLSPGDSPSTNLQFLTFFINVVKAINEHADLLRASIATTGNDHRLGANEAPPAIISVFTGSIIEKILNNFRKNGLVELEKEEEHMLNLNIPKIPEIIVDQTDRNRTSPFPFTGNKFEFRAVGSSANCSAAMTVLNTIVANQLIEFRQEVDGYIEGGLEKEAAIVRVLQQYLEDSEKIIFNGDGYSREWEKEASRRGLSNFKTTPEALEAYVSPSSIDLFTRHNIFNLNEIKARYHILLEEYIKKTEIELQVIDELVKTHIMPAANEYLFKFIHNLKGLKDLGLEKAADKYLSEVEAIYTLIDELKDNCELMLELREKAVSKKDHHSVALVYAQKVRPVFETIRMYADRLEVLIDDNIWKLPKYREMLFIK